MSVKPTSEFMKTLGEYVYCYTKDGTYKNAYYEGKGGDGPTGHNRCLDHIKNKGYDINDCYIVARNLEKFRRKSPSFLLESWLIWENDPEDNRVSGHYKECFIMANLSGLFSGYVDSQRDMFDEMAKLKEENNHLFGKGRIGESRSVGNNYKFQTNMRDNLYYGFKVQTSEPFIECYLKAGKESAWDSLLENAPEMLPEYTLDSTSVKNEIRFVVETMEEALDLWEQFYK